MAIGIARWLGFKIPTNFLSPYQSGSITDFWRRWHISLSSWLRDYLYIPLGGNRNASIATYIFTSLFFASAMLVFTHLLHYPSLVSLFFSIALLILFIFPSVLARDKKNIPTNLNLMTTMFLGGFWHGANWNFLVWGILHGIALALHKIWMLLTGKAFNRVNTKWWYNAMAIIITFHFVCFSWIFFGTADPKSTNDFDKAMNMIYQITHDFSFSVWGAFFENYKPVLGMMLLAAPAACYP